MRHGMTMANERRLYCGSSDLPLSEVGRAELVRLRKMVNYPNLQGLERLTSGMLRSDETLQLLFDARPDRRIPGFREIDFGLFELKSYEELKNDARYQAWICDTEGTTAPPGGESAQNFRRRVYDAVDAQTKDALIVCHGGVIAALMARWFPREERHLFQWQPEFGLGYEVELKNGECSYAPIGLPELENTKG